MSVVDHIVVAVDFSEPSRVALSAALQVAKTAGAKKVTVLHALRPAAIPSARQAELKQRVLALRDKVQAAARDQLRAMTDGLDLPCAVDYRVVVGTPARVIPPAARDLGGTLLAVGTHARRGIRRWLKGSVVEAMLPRLHLPTLVFAVGDDHVPPEVELADLRHVTVAVDTHEAAASVATRASDVIGALAAKKPAVTLMTVVDIDTPELAPDETLLAEIQGAFKGDAQVKLQALTAPFARGGYDVDVDVRLGDVEEEILQVVAERGSQLLVMGTLVDSDSFFDLGSTAAEVIRSCHVSVLVLPHSLELEGGA